MKKENKIMAAVSSDPQERNAIIRRMAIELGFALTPGDAGKIIRPDMNSIDLNKAYFVLCNNYNLRSSIITTQRLYEMAARGLAVVIGMKSIPREYEFICQVYYASDFGL